MTEINQHVSAIAARRASRRSGLQEVNTAVDHDGPGTQQNAAMVEQTTAASRNLASEAGQLKTLLAGFRLESDGGRQAWSAAA